MFSLDEPYCKGRLPALTKGGSTVTKASPHANTSDLDVLRSALRRTRPQAAVRQKPNLSPRKRYSHGCFPPLLSLRGCTDLERKKSCLLQSPIDFFFFNSILNSSQTLLQCTHILRFHPVTCWLPNNTLLC